MEPILSEDQELGVESFLTFLQNKKQTEFVIAGSPGSGKTFLVKYLVQTLRANPKIMELLLGKGWKYSLYFTATTNKAAEVLHGLLGEETSTVHSLFGLRPVNDFKTGNINIIRGKNYKVYEDSIIFIDEASMVNDKLLEEVRAATLNCKIVWIGDSNQLAPVKQITSPVFDLPNQVKLTTPHRQDKDSPIITIANSFKEAVTGGRFPLINSSKPSVNAVKGSDFEHAVRLSFLNGIDAKIIAWTNDRVIEYNAYVRDLLGHPKHYEVGEELIANSPIVINGSIKCLTDSIVEITGVEIAEHDEIPGMWLELNGAYRVFQANDFKRAKAVIKHYQKIKDWRKYFAAKDFYVDLRPGFASTIFKIQGATHHTVFIDVNDFAKCTQDNQIARMMHVGCSRPTDRLYLHGSLPKRLYDKTRV